MSMNAAGVANHLVRAELWSRELKDVLEDDLMASRYVRWLDGFPDGTTFTIPSLGEASVFDHTDDTPINYESLDTGEFQFSINEYVGSAHYITRQALQDSFYSSELLASFVPKQRRAIEEKLETDILALANSQTLADNNAINTAEHRWAASGTAEVMGLLDFSRAKYALKKANVPMRDLVAVVDPSVAYTLENITNLTALDANPRWEGIVGSGLTTGMRFIRNVYGFDVYESNYLPTTTETINDEADNSIDFSSGNTPVVNCFFSASPDVVPFVGAWRQMPTVDSEFNKDMQREEYVTTCRYGLALYRPENLVCVISRVSV
jgi:hypothetical protein